MKLWSSLFSLLWIWMRAWNKTNSSIGRNSWEKSANKWKLLSAKMKVTIKWNRNCKFILICSWKYFAKLKKMGLETWLLILRKFRVKNWISMLKIPFLGQKALHWKSSALLWIKTAQFGSLKSWSGRSSKIVPPISMWSSLSIRLMTDSTERVWAICSSMMEKILKLLKRVWRFFQNITCSIQMELGYLRSLDQLSKSGLTILKTNRGI